MQAVQKNTIFSTKTQFFFLMSFYFAIFKIIFYDYVFCVKAIVFCTWKENCPYFSQLYLAGLLSDSRGQIAPASQEPAVAAGQWSRAKMSLQLLLVLQQQLSSKK